MCTATRYASHYYSQYYMYVCCILPDCGHPGILLQGSVSIFVTENGSTIVTYYCDPGYSLNGSTTSLCVLGEWTPSPQTVTCIAEKDNVTSMPCEMERDGISNIQTFVCLQVQWMLVETVTVLAVH